MVADDTGGWVQLDLPLSEKARSFPDHAMELWFREFNTSTEEERWRGFLYRPLQELARGPLLDAGSLEDIESMWRVVSVIVNHHRPLNPRIGMATVVLDRKAAEIGITVYKLEESA